MPFLTARMAVSAVGVALLIAWPIVFSSFYELRVFALVGVFALLAMGYQFIFGHAGALSLAQGLFFGLGSYTTAILAVRLGLGFPATFAASIALPVIAAALIALSVLRLSSHYLALATLAISQIVMLEAVDQVSLTGGANGLPGVPAPMMFGLTVGRGFPMVVLIWGLVAVGAAFALWATGGLRGKTLQIVREDEIAARSIGIDTARIRFFMLLLSAGYAGAAGALYAHTVRIASPEALDLKTMITCLTIAVIGGRTNVWGAIVGALFVINLPEWLRFLEQSYVLVTAVLVLLVLIVAPGGLVGLIEKLFPLAQRPVPKDVTSIGNIGSEDRGPAIGATRTTVAAAPCSPSAQLLEIAAISKSFGGIRALSDVSFSLGHGSITGLIGANGSGKTTLVNCITGVEHIDNGRIVLDSTELSGWREHDIARKGVVRTFQNIRLVDDMSVWDNVAVSSFSGRRHLSGYDASASYARAADLLDHVGISDLGRMCGALPYGAKRRVEIARALALQPQLILLDEPAAGLNESEQNDLAARLQGLANTGATMLIVEHNMPFLTRLVSRMICLDQGKIIADGCPQDIYRNPDVLRAYLGSDFTQTDVQGS
ncbi:branched-chain amino acid ABC transporter ATP-binding protein/permease [Bradyrhizobium sp. dw_78]|uniref:branched-chain amino acid ABC transporter ATP-binding protein/permease n=1 Tax=Bradyrhizobium sp. dw_78 TaxID=2719793 RepID=UPI001BD6D6BD|nr:branched-chain amino acid ABC transporter ATP-binding protein/permease [Bradyrhizobium sp. dw_78]